MQGLSQAPQGPRAPQTPSEPLTSERVAVTQAKFVNCQELSQLRKLHKEVDPAIADSAQAAANSIRDTIRRLVTEASKPVLT